MPSWRANFSLVEFGRPTKVAGGRAKPTALARRLRHRAAARQSRAGAVEADFRGARPRRLALARRADLEHLRVRRPGF